MYWMISAVRTHKGNVRENNEDNFYMDGTYAQIEETGAGCAHRRFSKDDFQVYAVCDGMGGCDLGEAAAYAVVSNLNHLKTLLKTTGKKSIPTQIKSFLELMNAKCREIASQTDANNTVSGCTVCMVCIGKKNIYIANAGDSRVYLWKNKKLTQMTYDHKYAQNVLTQYIGTPENYVFEPYISTPFRIKKGDAFVLCSDGLTDMLGDGNISEKLSQLGDPAEICKSLTLEALSNGGSDNVTVMVLKCID